MLILSRHFLASYLRLFALALAGSLLLAAVFDMLVDFDDLVEHRDAFGGALAYLATRVAALHLPLLVPACSFVAAFLCVGLSAARHETVAMQAGGLSPRRVAVPLLLAAALLSGATLLLNESVLLGVTRRFVRLENPDLSAAWNRGSFWYHRGNTFYNVREAGPDSDTLRGVRLFAVNDRGRLVEKLSAEEGRIAEDERWHLRDAVRRRFEPGAPAAPGRTERVAEAVVGPGRGSDALREAGESTLALSELRDVIALREAQGRDALRYRAMLHLRLAAPASVFVFALLALPVALSVERHRSLAAAAAGGLALVALFHAAWWVATLVGRSGFPAAIIAPWLVIAAFTALPALLLTRAR